ncbi:HAD-like domain-containing protein [Blastocladiella britannica]|nr:HAD-like domain-containing protein [Blastocladiella britannica]
MVELTRALTSTRTGRALPAAALAPYKLVVADIEGTTTDIAFVHSTLFPYARARLGEYLRDPAHARDPAVLDIVEALVSQSRIDGADDKFVPVIKHSTDLDEVVTYLEWLMSNDRKVAPLKTLQGLIWEHGYNAGTLRGHVYCDVVPALYYWHAVRVPVAIYSSGSVHAQKLLFGASEYGHLKPLLAAYFDTAVGPKTDATSYTAILSRLAEQFPEMTLAANDVLFLSDNPAELAAAAEAGWQVALAVRPGNPLVTDDAIATYPTFTDFSQLIAPHTHARPSSPIVAATKRARSLSGPKPDVASSPESPAAKRHRKN